MLGKTNITVLSEGAIVTEVEDFKWIQMQSGIYSDFKKAIYKNGYLAAITEDGTVAYTTDGEVWNTAAPEYKYFKLNDIDWDGSNFILAGRYLSEKDSSSKITGLIVKTTDFKDFVTVELTYYMECYAVMPQNGGYAIVARGKYDVLYAVFTDYEATLAGSKQLTMPSSWEVHHCIMAKNSAEMLAYTHVNSTHGSNNLSEHNVHKIYNKLAELVVSSREFPDVKAMMPLECKGSLYFMDLLSERNYNLNKVTESSEMLIMCTGQNFMFVDGAYFNGCQLFINSHEMLVVRKGESIADKNLDDLIEIAPEFTMNCIIKAFGKLYIFGNQGVVLKSSVETDNEEAIAVQTLSAKKALAEAKAYADARYEELAARVTALENQQTQETQEAGS